MNTILSILYTLVFSQFLVAENTSTNAMRRVELEFRPLAEEILGHVFIDGIPADVAIGVVESEDEASKGEIRIRLIGDHTRIDFHPSYRRLLDALIRRYYYLVSMESEGIDITIPSNAAVTPAIPWAEELAVRVAEGTIPRYKLMNEKDNIHNLRKGDTFPKEWLVSRFELPEFTSSGFESLSDEAKAFLSKLEEEREIWRFQDRAWTVFSNHGYVILDRDKYVDSLLYAQGIGRINVANKAVVTTPGAAAPSVVTP